MRHRKAGRQFGRNTSHRRAMFRALAANLVAHERLETTEAKAKELRRVAERLVTRAKRLGPVAYTAGDQLTAGDRAKRLAASRQIGRFLGRFAVVGAGEHAKKIDLVEKVMVELAKRYEKRPGGYTRIVKVGRRRGDDAPMTLIEFVDRPARKAEEKPAKKAATPNAAAAVTASAATTDEKAVESPAAAPPAESTETPPAKSKASRAKKAPAPGEAKPRSKKKKPTEES